MPKPRAPALFTLGAYWIKREPGRSGFYCYWFDAGSGRVRRRKLASVDLEAAKIELAKFIVTGAPKSAASYLAVVLDTYTKDVTDTKPSADPAKRAVALIVEYMTEVAKIRAPRITDFDAGAQAKFAAWCARDKDHAVKTISRNLSVAAAAMEHAKIAHAIAYQPNDVAEMLEAERAPIKEELRRFIPTDEELGRFLDHAGDGRLFRAVMIMLGTACRPEAALDLTPLQINREDGLVDLNPKGRRQTRKYRPVVRVPATLGTWLTAWEKAWRDKRQEPGCYVGYTSVDSLQTAVTRTRKLEKVQLPDLVAYSLRHKMASVLRRSRVPEDQIAVQLGHRRPNLRTTGDYGEFAPDYLNDAAAAIEAYFVRLQSFTKRSLFNSHGTPANEHKVIVPLR